MSGAPEYTVWLDDQAAWSIVYQDQHGKVSYVFEPGEEKKRMYLNPLAAADGKMIEPVDMRLPRFVLATERVKAYLESCGYEVLIDE